MQPLARSHREQLMRGNQMLTNNINVDKPLMTDVVQNVLYMCMHVCSCTKKVLYSPHHTMCSAHLTHLYTQCQCMPSCQQHTQASCHLHLCLTIHTLCTRMPPAFAYITSCINCAGCSLHTCKAALRPLRPLQCKKRLICIHSYTCWPRRP